MADELFPEFFLKKAVERKEKKIIFINTKPSEKRSRDVISTTMRQL
jgi:hypothetical protein